jgi:hypothetical protein
MKAGKFPQCVKLYDDVRNSHPVWLYNDIIEHFKKCGLPIREIETTFEVA